MLINPIDKIRHEIHKCLATYIYLPHDNKTYCNIFVYEFLSKFNLENNFYSQEKKRIMLANEMYDQLVNKGYKKISLQNIDMDDNIYLASQKGKEHGHIAVIYPSHTKTFSSKWDMHVPLVANVGNEVGIMGLNWAFREMPEIFLYAKI